MVNKGTNISYVRQLTASWYSLETIGYFIHIILENYEVLHKHYPEK